MVSIVVQNLVEIDAVASKTWNFQYFARLAWKRIFTPPKLGFSGDFTPKMGGNVNETAKSHILARVRVVWAIKRENPSSRLTCRWVHGKNKNEKKFRYISPICPEAPHRRIWTKFGSAIGAAPVPNFLVIGQGVFILWGSKIAISHWQSQSPLTQGWRYRAARDYHESQKGLTCTGTHMHGVVPIVGFWGRAQHL